MTFDKSIRPAASDDSMVGCECALPFLTLQPDAWGRWTLSGFALGAAVALGACDASPEATPQTEPQDKVGAAFSKVEREITRAKARWNREPAAARGSADAASAARH
jgi:hypothetical protein